GNVEPQDAVGHLGLDAVALNGAGQRDRPLECAVAPLDAVIVALLVLGGLALLALRRRVIVVQRRLDIFGLDTRQRELDLVAVSGLAQIEWWGKATRTTPICAWGDEAILEQLTHGLAQRQHVVERIPACQVSHCRFLLIAIPTYFVLRISC